MADSTPGNEFYLGSSDTLLHVKFELDRIP